MFLFISHQMTFCKAGGAVRAGSYSALSPLMAEESTIPRSEPHGHQSCASLNGGGPSRNCTIQDLRSASVQSLLMVRMFTVYRYLSAGLSLQEGLKGSAMRLSDEFLIASQLRASTQQRRTHQNLPVLSSRGWS